MPSFLDKNLVCVCVCAWKGQGEYQYANRIIIS